MTQMLIPIRWNSIPNGSWEIILSQILVRQSLGMEEGSVSVVFSSLSTSLLRCADPTWKGCESGLDPDFVIQSWMSLLLPPPTAEITNSLCSLLPNVQVQGLTLRSHRYGLPVPCH